MILAFFLTITGTFFISFLSWCNANYCVSRKRYRGEHWNLVQVFFPANKFSAAESVSLTIVCLHIFCRISRHSPEFAYDLNFFSHYHWNLFHFIFVLVQCKLLRYKKAL